MNDIRQMVYATIVAFLLFLVFWFSVVYISACGFTLSCNQAAPFVERTPIPTLIPVKQSASLPASSPAAFNKCQIAADDLIGAWVSAGYSKTEPFPFTDMNGHPCEGTFANDIQHLFMDNSLWYPGAIGCISCHNADLSERSGGLDLTTYEAMQMGSQRADPNAKGKDIFGGGDWEKSLLHKVLVNQGLVPEGHSPDVPAHKVILYAGQQTAEVEVTITPTP